MRVMSSPLSPTTLSRPSGQPSTSVTESGVSTVRQLMRRSVTRSVSPGLGPHPPGSRLMAASLAVLPEVMCRWRPGPLKEQSSTVRPTDGCIILMPLQDELMSQWLTVILRQ